MGFVVTGPAGTGDAEFEAYARWLHQRGKDLGNLPRVPDPQNPKRRRVSIWRLWEAFFSREVEEVLNRP
jgi:hypothetical protein